MFDCDAVFARHEKFNRSALAKLVTWDHLRGSTWLRRNLAKLLAKAEIEEKDVLFPNTFLSTVTGNTGYERTSSTAS
jgi:hypothetical protein